MSNIATNNGYEGIQRKTIVKIHELALSLQPINWGPPEKQEDLNNSKIQFIHIQKLEP